MTMRGDSSRAVWRKSSHSSNGCNCVEVGARRCGDAAGHAAAWDHMVCAVRDSKDPDGPRLYFTRREWETFTRSVKDGTLGGLG